MKVTDFTRRALAVRREQRDMVRQGWKKHETDWEIMRGGPFECRKVILDVRISVDGKHVWTKTGMPRDMP